MSNRKETNAGQTGGTYPNRTALSSAGPGGASPLAGQDIVERFT